MIDIATFALFESSQNISNGQGGVVQQLTGPVTILRPKFVPSNYSFAVSIGVRGLDMHNENSMHIILKNPSGDVLSDLGEKLLPIAGEDDILPIEYSGFVACIDFRIVVIETSGAYILEVYVNNSLIGTKEIPVYVRSVNQ